MVLTLLDGNLELGAHVYGEIGNFKSQSFSKKTFFTLAHRVLGYHLHKYMIGNLLKENFLYKKNGQPIRCKNLKDTLQVRYVHQRYWKYLFRK